jgi:hypothetical protein
MRNYRIPKKYFKSRHYNGKCEQCGEVTPLDKIYSRVDGNNIAITYNAPYLCGKCIGIKQEASK